MSRGGEEKNLFTWIVPLRCVLNLGTITQVKYENSLEDNKSNKEMYKRQDDFIRGSANAYSTLW
jgi:hypothetical protein